MSAVKKIVALFTQAGAQAKVSSIHVNGWFGDYDKLAMTRVLFEEVFKIALDAEKNRVVYAGDSPNDEPMFRYFPHSVGVANVLNFTDQINHLPAYVTNRMGGDGFGEIVTHLLDVVS